MANIDDFNQIKSVLTALDVLRPARFAYTQAALDATGTDEINALDGTYAIDDSSQINSIPDADQVAMDNLIMSIGLRSQGATISRMMVNHFFGRLSLNLLKLTEKVKLLASTHLVNRYIAASGKLVEYLSLTYTSTKITIGQHLSSLSADAPDTSVSNIDIEAAVSEGNAGLMTGADKKRLDDAVIVSGDQTVAGIKTFSSIPVLPASDPTTANQAARKDYVDSKLAASVTVEIGSIIITTEASPDDTHFLACDGRAISRSTYAELFTIIASSYGSGDGTTTFNIPDLRGVFVRGAGTNGSMQNNNSGYYGGGAVGNKMLDQTLDHVHTVSVQARGTGTALNYLTGKTSASDYSTVNMSVGGVSVRGGDETRPASVSINYKIRVA